MTYVPAGACTLAGLLALPDVSSTSSAGIAMLPGSSGTWLSWAGLSVLT